MATIRKRPQADGSVRHQALIRLKQAGKIIHQETKTFSREALARDWARRREVELEHPGAIAKAKAGDTSLGALIKWYIEEFETESKWQRTKGADLRRLQKYDIAKVAATEITSEMLVDHIRQRRREGAGPATAANDLIWIGVVLRTAKPLKRLPLDASIVIEARDTCARLRLIGKSRKRDRRPTDEELAKLYEHYRMRDRRMPTPMLDILEFAIQSGRRQSEICRLEWADNDEKAMSGLVRDAKHPRHKEGNHKRFKYTAEAWAIVQRQPKESEYIFPYEPTSVGSNFAHACKLLGIEDLHFHDLRHEATSRLFERGYQIHEVAQFTLHESWNELKRYTNLSPGKLKLRSGEP